MVTTQFTGCTFCWTSHGGIVRAAHIGPIKAGHTSTNLATTYNGDGNAVATRIAA